MTINIIFDADDTLWVTEELYNKARHKFIDLMVKNDLGPASKIENHAKDIDKRNATKMGLSRERFPKSLVDTYEERCKSRGVQSDDAVKKAIFDIGNSVFETVAKPIDGVRPTLSRLKENGCKLFLWTQGDEAVQKKRLKDSGFTDLFSQIKITDSKTVEGLKDLLREWNLDAKDTWMVGNSIRSDINTAIQAGLQAVWIPSEVWDREKEPLQIPTDESVYQVNRISEIDDVILRVANADEIKQQATVDGAVAYLFVSAYHNLYRQYILDILAYPKGYIFRFPYDNKRWLPLPYRDSDAKLEEFANLLAGKDAIIVFVDDRIEGEPRRSQQFFPIRFATITERPKTGGGMLHIEFALGEYVHYRDAHAVTNYNRIIKELAARPRANSEDCAYISIGPSYQGRILSAGPNQDDDAWQSIVNQLGRLRSLSNNSISNPVAPTPADPFQRAMFFRIVDLVNIQSNKQIPLAKVLQNDTGYEINSSQNYRLNLQFYSPKHPLIEVRRSQIKAELTSEFINGVGSTQIPLNFRYDRRHIDFITDRVFTDVWSSISLGVESDDNKNFKKEVEQVVTPSPTLLLKIKTTPWVTIIVPLTFAIASIISTLNEQFAGLLVALIPSVKDFQDLISAALAVIGSSTATILLFYLYRKLK